MEKVVLIVANNCRWVLLQHHTSSHLISLKKSISSFLAVMAFGGYGCDLFHHFVLILCLNVEINVMDVVIIGAWT